MADNLSNIEQAILNFIENEDKSNYTARNNLKKTYSNYRKTKRAYDELSLVTLDRISNLILNYYDQLKDITEINEILDLIIEDYKYLNENRKLDNNQLRTRIFNIRTYSLGNPGASSKGLEYEEIEEIIKRKIQDEDEFLVNRDDVLNILKEKLNSVVYGDYDRYQKLIEDVVMTSVEDNIESITNPKAIDVLRELAISYKNQGNYEKSKEIYEKCLELYSKIERDSSAIKYEFSRVLSKQEENKEIEPVEPEEPKVEPVVEPKPQTVKKDIENEFEKVKDFSKKFNELFEEITPETDLTKKFISIGRVTKLEDLVKGLKGEVTVEEEIKKVPGEINVNPPSPNPKKEKGNNYIMPVHEKIEGIQEALRKTGFKIKKVSVFRNVDDDNSSEIIRIAKSTLNDYSEYVLLDIEGLNVSLLECLTSDQKSLQIILNEDLFEILQFEKVRDQRLNGAVLKYHTQDTFGEHLKQELEHIKECRDTGKPIIKKKVYSKDQIQNEPENEEQEPNAENDDKIELDKSDMKAVLRHRLKILIGQINYKTQELIELKGQNAEKEAIKAQLLELIKQKNDIQEELDKLLK